MKIVVRGVRSQSGFGVATIGLLRLLSKAGYDTRYIPLTGDKTQDAIGISNDTIEYLSSITIDQTDEFINDSTFIDVGALSYGLNISKPKNIKKHILYVTTETTTINPHYVEAFNNKFDEIWTASKFNTASFFSSGVDKPIKILPHLIDTEKFNPELKPLKIKNKKGFNYIVNIDFSFRKGLHVLLPAWMNTFKRSDDVSLILKISNGNFNDPSQAIKAINQLLFNFNYNSKIHAPILIIPSMIDEKYIPNLYTTGDVYVAPTLGEGFGLPIAEAMACGVPTIVSNCSAPSEYTNDNTSFLIGLDDIMPIQEIKDKTLLMRDPSYQGRYIYNISIDSLSKQLWNAYDVEESELYEMGIAARQLIIDRFSFEPLIKTLNELLKD